MWECTECDLENELDPDAEEGQIIICAECDAEYEIGSFDPLELRLLDTPLAVDGDADSEEDDDEDEDDY